MEIEIPIFKEYNSRTSNVFFEFDDLSGHNLDSKLNFVNLEIENSAILMNLSELSFSVGIPLVACGIVMMLRAAIVTF